MALRRRPQAHAPDRALPPWPLRFARDTLRYLARQKKETFNWEKVKNDIIEKGGYIHYITSDVGRPTE